MRKRVAVLYKHPLFGRGIARLLSKDDLLDVTCVPAGPAEPPPDAMTFETDAVVVEDEDDPSLVELLIQALPPVLVVVVSLQDNGMQIYQDRRRILPRSHELPDLIHEVFGATGAPATTAVTPPWQIAAG